jgi:hypothetical protein
MVSPTFGSADDALEKLHVSPEHAGSLITDVGATLSAGSATVTVCVFTGLTLPNSSFAVSVTV